MDNSKRNISAQNQDSEKTDIATTIKEAVWEMRFWFLLALLLILLSNIVGLKIGIVNGVSMEPTFSDHGLFVTIRVRDCATLQRGDVITFQSNQPGIDDCVKRIVALPGETIEAHGNILYVDGQEAGPSGGIWRWGRYTVPEDSVFVIGDNRANSYDSRAYGPVQFSQIESKVICPITLFP